MHVSSIPVDPAIKDVGPRQHLIYATLKLAQERFQDIRNGTVEDLRDILPILAFCDNMLNRKSTEASSSSSKVLERELLARSFYSYFPVGPFHCGSQKLSHLELEEHSTRKETADDPYLRFLGHYAVYPLGLKENAEAVCAQVVDEDSYGCVMPPYGVCYTYHLFILESAVDARLQLVQDDWYAHRRVRRDAVIASGRSSEACPL